MKLICRYVLLLVMPSLFSLSLSAQDSVGRSPARLCSIDRTPKICALQPAIVKTKKKHRTAMGRFLVWFNRNVLEGEILYYIGEIDHQGHQDMRFGRLSLADGSKLP